MEVPKADVVGERFVTRYYPNLFNWPPAVHQYYTDSSRLLRAEAGNMGNTRIAQNQNEIQSVLMSMDHENCRAEILTVDALDSINGSVFVLVTGAIHKDDITQKFVQSFFLGYVQGKYFVLNDIFRYLDEETQRHAPPVDNDIDGTYENFQTALSTGAVPEASGFAPSAMYEEAFFAENLEFSDHVKSVYSEQQRTVYHQMTEPFPSENLRPVEQLSDVLLPPSEEVSDGKISYAAILRLQSDSHTSSRTAHQPVSTPEQPLSFHHNSFSQLSRARTPTKAKQEPVPVEKKVDLRSVFVKNLPANIMNSQLEDEMSRFGPLRPNRVCLKSNKSGFVYAFVDFEDSTSAQAAIEASPILIGNRKVYIEKRTSVYVGDRGRGHGPR